MEYRIMVIELEILYQSSSNKVNKTKVVFEKRSLWAKSAFTVQYLYFYVIFARRANHCPLPTKPLWYHTFFIYSNVNIRFTANY